MRKAEVWLAGLLLAVLVIGAALLPLTTSTFTRALARRYALAGEAGLPAPRMLEIAEQVRAFVISGRGDSLPATVDGRSGFDAAAVSHLVDVRRVIAWARLATGIAAILVASWIVLLVRRERVRALASACFAGAALCVGFLALAVMAGAVSFDALFTWFHGLFFSAGTWEFPADALLIQVFPEPFWAAAAAWWAGLVLLGAVLLGLFGWLVRRFAPERRAQQV